MLAGGGPAGPFLAGSGVDRSRTRHADVIVMVLRPFRYVVMVHPVGVEAMPSVARRARFAAVARRLKSASTMVRPRTRARRPPCLRRIRCASFRSILGRVARYRACHSGSVCPSRARASAASYLCTRIVRPAAALVHRDLNRYAKQCAANDAVASPCSVRLNVAGNRSG